MAKDCLYHAKKGDIPVVEGHCIYYLREQTLRGIMSGEAFYKDGMDKFYALKDDVKGDSCVYAVGYDPEIRKVKRFTFSKSDKFLRVKGVRCFTEKELEDVADLEIRTDITDSGSNVFDVYLQLEGDSEFLETFETIDDAEKYVRNYRMTKFLNVA